MRLVRTRAPLRRAMARLASRLIATRTWERLGFARLGDYAVERLGYSARSMHDLAHVHEALAALPHIDAAFVSGRIPWTKTRLLARVATPANEEEWIERARHSTATALAHEVRRVSGSTEGWIGLDSEEEGDEGEGTKYDHVRIHCTPQVHGKWHHARQLAWRLVGHPLRPWECAELVAAEVLSALPPSGTTDDGTASRQPLNEGDECDKADRDVSSPAARLAPPLSPGECSDGQEATECAPVSEGRPGTAPRNFDGDAPEPLPCVRSLCENLDRADPFQLDRRLRRAVRLEQGLDREIGVRLSVVARGSLYLALGFPSLEAYVRERLGMAPRKARGLLCLHRATRICPPLGDAYRRGHLSWVQAQALIPVILIVRRRSLRDAWIRWAMQVSFRRLRDDVERALLLNEADPAAFARAAGLPDLSGETLAGAPGSDGRDALWTTGAIFRMTSGSPIAGFGDVPGNAEVAVGDPEGCDRQIGARSGGFAETTHLSFHAPREVAGLFRAVLCAVRRAIEQQTGRTPTEGEAFEAMLEHAADEWMPPGSQVRAAHRVFARDGWRCTVPGCSSFRNLHDHHIVFRSAGGGNDLDNRTTLCAGHHLRGVHAGVVRCTGKAFEALRFELGVRIGKRPLLSFGPGERLRVPFASDNGQRSERCSLVVARGTAPPSGRGHRVAGTAKPAAPLPNAASAR